MVKETQNEFLMGLKKALKDDNTSILDQGEASAEYSGYFSSGSLSFDALISGSIYKGMPDNKVIMLAAESSTGKSFFSLALVKGFMNKYPDGLAIVYDTESATNREMFQDRGIDPKRVLISEPETVQQFRTHAMNVVDEYMKTPPKERPKIIMVLDSLGALSTEKEQADIIAGASARDMTRAQLIRGTFRALRLRLSKAGIPLIICNHVYQTMDLYSPDAISGGNGSKYAADIIITLSKRKERDKDKDVIGNIITCKLFKSRLTKENSSIETKLSYSTGLSRYHGLIEAALEAGVFKKLAKGYEFEGKRVMEGQIAKNPEKYYTPENLEKIDKVLAKNYLYGQSEEDVMPENLEDGEE